MNNKKKFKTVKQVLLAYYLRSLPIPLITLIAYFFLLKVSYIAAFCLLLFYTVTIGLCQKIIAGRTINSTLIDHLDAKLYHDVVTSKGIIRSEEHLINAYSALGNLQGVANVTTKELKANPTLKLKYYYLSHLASVYFTTRDREKLALVCDAYEKCLESDKKPDIAKKRYPIFRFIRYYLEGRYDAAIATYDNECNTPLYKLPYNKLTVDFKKAVAYYDLGDLEKAREMFSEIAAVETVGISSFAKEYLRAIDEGDSPRFKEILPTDDLPKYTSLTKTIRTSRIFKITALSIVFAAVILLTIISNMNKGISYEEYVERVDAALALKYESYEIVDVFNVNYDGEFITALCVITTPEGVDTLTVLKGKTPDTLYLDSSIFGETMKVDKRYLLGHPKVMIEANLITEAPNAEDYYKVITIPFEDTVLYYTISLSNVK